MDINKKPNPEKLKTKKCAYPGCETSEVMTKRGKYCQKHRKTKYKNILEKKAKNKKARKRENHNQIIKHKFIEVQTVKMECNLEGCYNTFELKIIPRVYVYPKYCPEHRNSHKRKMFINNE